MSLTVSYTSVFIRLYTEIPHPSNRGLCTSLFTSNKMLGTHKCSLPLGFICDIFSVYSRFPQSSSFFAQFLCFFSLVSDDFREFIEAETLSFPWAILTTKYRTDRHLNAGDLSLFYSHCLVVVVLLGIKMADTSMYIIVCAGYEVRY